MIAWRDLRGLRDPDRFDAWLQRLLINVCIAQATRERRRTANLRVLPVDGPAGPDDLLSVAERDLLERGFRRLPPEQRAILVHAPLPRLRAVGDRRDARHPGRHGPLATPSRTSRHAGRPRGGRSDHGHGRSIGMTQQRDIERLLDHWFDDGPIGDARSRRRRRRRPHRASIPATRLAPPIGGHSHEHSRQSSRPRRGGRPSWPSSATTCCPARSTGVGGPAPTASASPTATPTSDTRPPASPVALPRTACSTAVRLSHQAVRTRRACRSSPTFPHRWVGVPANAAVTSPAGSNGRVLTAAS